MDLKDWTGTTTFLARSMLTLGTVAVMLSLAKEVSLAVVVVESDVETVAVMVGSNTHLYVSLFFSLSLSLSNHCLTSISVTTHSRC